MSETINEALVKVVTGEKGNTNHFWWRKSRTNWRTLENQLFSLPNFYYAKVYEYKKGRKIGNRKNSKGKRKSVHEKGTVGRKLAYIYWNEGILTTVKEN